MPDINAYLAPRSVAVIGASNDTEILRGRILKVMRCHDFAGPIYPVSRSSDEVMGLKAYRTITEVPDPVDLAILIIPAEFVPDTLRECGRKGVKAAQIITSGFAEEVGEAGARQQTLIREIAAEFDMAVCGPNSEGFTNTRALLAATFSPVMDHPERPLVPEFRSDGFISVIAQSGGIGFSFFDRGRPKELPFNYIITTGNEAALEEMDLVDHLIDADQTDVFMLFMEDVKTPAKLVAVAEKALRAGKPLIVTKIGKSGAGQRAAASHTAALAGAYAGYRALFERYGIIEGNHIEEMVDIAAGFSRWGKRLPRGKRIGITTGSGGGGGWMADTAELEGLEVPVLDAATRARIDEFLPPYGTSQNPVDGTAQAVRRIGYARMAQMVAESPVVDAVITITSARHGSSYRREEALLTELARETHKPIAFCSYTNPQEGAMEFLNRCGIPLYTDMRNCARAFAAMADYRALRERFLRIPEIRTAPATTRDQVAGHLERCGPVLCEYQARPLFAAYGLGADTAGTLARSAEEALAAAEQMGGAVALKVQSPDILHKTEAGGVRVVRVDRADPAADLVRQAAALQA
ncbi:MAG: CoA-binding protein, partial [Gammaproteobacteria bacterium]|nr:CoA-binding protein [Gammaproteobacteria bacterium]